MAGWRRRAARWNHNVHYHRLVLDAVPGGGRVLDVGCGEGVLTRELAAKASRVVGLDLDRASIDLARTTTAAANVDYVRADLMRHPFEPESFDAVVSVAALHHIGTEAGLMRMRELVRPGGVIAVVGLAASASPIDQLWDLAGAVWTRVLRLTRTWWEHAAPKVWDTPDSYREVRRSAERVLPGVRFRRLLLWRYALVWRKPDRA
jgi:2-polyprenyl-3-methyl-5-hydroxy-6-metoxy-1,4-benzoquinol methylase